MNLWSRSFLLPPIKLEYWCWKLFQCCVLPGPVQYLFPVSFVYLVKVFIKKMNCMVLLSLNKVNAKRLKIHTIKIKPHEITVSSNEINLNGQYEIALSLLGFPEPLSSPVFLQRYAKRSIYSVKDFPWKKRNGLIFQQLVSCDLSSCFDHVR